MGLREKATAISATIQAAEELRGLTATTATTNGGGGRVTPGEGTASPGPFTSFGEQLRAVIAAGGEGRQADPRLYEVRAASGLNESVGNEGGFLIQQDYSTSLLTAGMTQAKLAPLCNPFPIGPDSSGVQLPMLDETSRATGSRFGGLRLYWGGETDTATATKPKFRMLNLKLNKLLGACYLTDEIMQDSTVLENFVRLAFGAEYSYVIDDRILRGIGAGQPLGILNSGALVTVNKESGQAADTIVTENITNMYARSSAPEKSVWVCNIDTFPQLATLQVGVGAAGSMVGLLRDGIAGSPSGMGMYGRPVIWAEQASGLGDLGDVSFIDFSRYLLASKGGLQTALSMHVRFLQSEQVLRFVYRCDGQPDINSAITPANGNSTVSPFVVLQAR